MTVNACALCLDGEHESCDGTNYLSRGGLVDCECACHGERMKTEEGRLRRERYVEYMATAPTFDEDDERWSSRRGSVTAL